MLVNILYPLDLLEYTVEKSHFNTNENLSEREQLVTRRDDSHLGKYFYNLTKSFPYFNSNPNTDNDNSSNRRPQKSKSSSYLLLGHVLRHNQRQSSFLNSRDGDDIININISAIFRIDDNYMRTGPNGGSDLISTYCRNGSDATNLLSVVGIIVPHDFKVKAQIEKNGPNRSCTLVDRLAQASECFLCIRRCPNQKVTISTSQVYENNFNVKKQGVSENEKIELCAGDCTVFLNQMKSYVKNEKITVIFHNPNDLLQAHLLRSTVAKATTTASTDHHATSNKISSVVMHSELTATRSPAYPNILQFLFSSIEQTYCSLIIQAQSRDSELRKDLQSKEKHTSTISTEQRADSKKCNNFKSRNIKIVSSAETQHNKKITRHLKNTSSKSHNFDDSQLDNLDNGRGPIALFSMDLVSTSADHHECLLKMPCASVSRTSHSKSSDYLISNNYSDYVPAKAGTSEKFVMRQESSPILSEERSNSNVGNCTLSNISVTSQTNKFETRYLENKSCFNGGGCQENPGNESKLHYNLCDKSTFETDNFTTLSAKAPKLQSLDAGASSMRIIELLRKYFQWFSATSNGVETGGGGARKVLVWILKCCISSSCAGEQIFMRLSQLEQCYLMFRSTQFSVLWLSPYSRAKSRSKTAQKTVILENSSGHDIKSNTAIYPGMSMASQETYASVTLDITLGVIVTILLMFFIGPSQWFDIAMKHALSIVDSIQRLLLYLMGMPVGLKLNLSLNNALGSLFLYHFYLWKTFVTLIRPFLAVAIQVLLLSGLLGLSCLISVLCDLLAVVTVHIYCFYGYAARFHNLQIKGLIALWRLFRGKKWNMLRHRVDSHHYGTDQLFVGTLTFTILIFFMPTILTYYLVFFALRAVTRGLQDAMRKSYESLTVIPINTIVLWLLGSQKIASQVYFKPLSKTGLKCQTVQLNSHYKGAEIYMTPCFESIDKLLLLKSQSTREHIQSWNSETRGILQQNQQSRTIFSQPLTLATMMNKLLFGELF